MKKDPLLLAPAMKMMLRNPNQLKQQQLPNLMSRYDCLLGLCNVRIYGMKFDKDFLDYLNQNFLYKLPTSKMILTICMNDLYKIN